MLGRAAAIVRTGVGALAIAVALQLLFRVSLLATFRVALIVLACVEILQFGWRVLSDGPRATLWLEIAVKLAVLAIAYAALSA